MRTSLNNIKRSEDFLHGAMPGGESALFQSQMILDTDLRQNVAIQKFLYKIIRSFGRRAMKQKVENIHREIFSDPSKHSFREAVYNEFKNQ